MKVFKMLFDNVFHLGMIGCLINGLSFAGEGEGGTAGTENNEGAGTQGAEGAGAGATQDVQAGGQQAANAGTQEVTDWTKDARYPKMWSIKNQGDPNRLYKSYREIEKIYEPTKKERDTLKSQVSELSEFLKGYGVELSKDKLKAVLDEHKSYTSNDFETLHPLMKIGRTFEPWIKNPDTFEKLDKFVRQFEQEDLQRRFPNMNAEQIAKQRELENKNKEFEDKFSKLEQEKALQSDIATVNSQIDRFKKYAETRGFAFTEDIRKAFIDQCIKEDVPVNGVFARAMEVYGEQVDKFNTERIRLEHLKELQKQKGNVILSAKTGAKTETGKKGSAGLAERLRNFYTGGQGT